MKWEIVKLVSLTTKITKGTTPSNVGCEFTNEGINYIRSECLTNSKHPDNRAFLHIDEVTHERLKRSQIQSQDILFSMAGVFLGKTAIARECDVPANTNQAVAIIRINSELYNANYVYYFLNQVNVVRLINSVSGQSAQPNINLAQIGDLNILLPPLPIQTHIAGILSAYDNLIENNQKQIKLLEESARLLYKEWFVNLRFPGYENTTLLDGVPDGWLICELNDVIDFDPNVKFVKNMIKKTVPMAALNTNSMVINEALITKTTSNAGSKFCNGDTLVARITPCLENGKTAFVGFLDDNENAVGSTEFIVLRSKKLNPYLLYCIARNDEFRNIAINSMTGADGRQRVRTEKLKSIKCYLPDEAMINLSCKYLKPMFDEVQLLNKQSWQLQKVRDKLLPKLMSGEIEV